MAKRWTPKAKFHPGGTPGKLHRRLGVPDGEKIPAARLASAARSDDPETRREAIRAETMKKWHHGKKRRAALYDHPRSSHGG